MKFLSIKRRCLILSVYGELKLGIKIRNQLFRIECEQTAKINCNWMYYRFDYIPLQKCVRSKFPIMVTGSSYKRYLTKFTSLNTEQISNSLNSTLFHVISHLLCLFKTGYMKWPLTCCCNIIANETLYVKPSSFNLQSSINLNICWYEIWNEGWL